MIYGGNRTQVTLVSQEWDAVYAISRRPLDYEVLLPEALQCNRSLDVAFDLPSHPQPVYAPMRAASGALLRLMYSMAGHQVS